MGRCWGWGGSAALLCCHSLKILWNFDPYRLDNSLPSHTLISLGFQRKLKKKKKKTRLKTQLLFWTCAHWLKPHQRVGSHSMENIPKYSSHFSQKPCASLGPCTAMGRLWGRTTPHSHCFAFCLRMFALNLLPCQNHTGWGKEEKTPTLAVKPFLKKVT